MNLRQEEELANQMASCHKKVNILVGFVLLMVHFACHKTQKIRERLTNYLDKAIESCEFNAVEI